MVDRTQELNGFFKFLVDHSSQFNLNPLYEFFAPEDDREFNRQLLNYDSVSIREILARYRSLFPEYATSCLDLALRAEAEKFASKVKVNVEFFEVFLPETARSG